MKKLGADYLFKLTHGGKSPQQYLMTNVGAQLEKLRNEPCTPENQKKIKLIEKSIKDAYDMLGSYNRAHFKI